MWRSEVGEDGGELQVAQQKICYLVPVWRGEVGEDGRKVEVKQEQV